jgi:hypothetical protein
MIIYHIKKFNNIIINKMKKRKKYLLLIPILLTLCVCLHFIISPSWFNEDWSYSETSLFAFVLGLCNSIPFAYRVFKTKNTQSFSILTLSCNMITGIFGTIIQTYNGYNGINSCVMYGHNVSQTLMVLRWVPDMIVSYIGLLTASYVFIKKIKNIIKDKNKENIKIKFTNTITTVFCIIITSMIIIGLSILMYYKIKNDKHT